MESGGQERFQLKVSILQECALLGSGREYLCREKNTCKETGVGVESMACSGNYRELRTDGCGMCGEGEKSWTTKNFLSY